MGRAKFQHSRTGKHILSDVSDGIYPCVYHGVTTYMLVFITVSRRTGYTLAFIRVSRYNILPCV